MRVCKFSLKHSTEKRKKHSTGTSCVNCNTKAFGENRTHDPANLVRRSVIYMCVLCLWTMVKQINYTISIWFTDKSVKDFLTYSIESWTIASDTNNCIYTRVWVVMINCFTYLIDMLIFSRICMYLTSQISHLLGTK